MGYYDNCLPDERFASIGSRLDSTYGTEGSPWIIIDWDQRRVVSVETSWREGNEDFIIEALAKHIDDGLPRDALLLEIGRAGELISYSTKAEDDDTLIPSYQSTTNFPPHIPRVRRSDLTEKERMGVQVNLVNCKAGSGNDQNSRQLAFKYYFTPNNIALVWNEINCWMRLPPHPSIVPFNSLVLDSVPTLAEGSFPATHDEEKVVGFTTCFIPGGTIFDNTSRPFRLTHLRQLISVVDYLNLDLGIVHGDIRTYNLLIEPDTDTIKIFNFNSASHLGDTEGDTSTRYDDVFYYDEDRNDVKYTILTLYEIITRDIHFRQESYPHELDVAAMLPAVWRKHPEVHLDAPVEEYRRGKFLTRACIFLFRVFLKSRDVFDSGETKNYYTLGSCLMTPVSPFLRRMITGSQSQSAG